MANVGLITLYDKGCLGVRYLSSLLKEKGHRTSLIYLERHEGKIKDRRDNFSSDEDLWIGVNEYGADLIRSYADPISEKDIDILLNLLGRLKPDIIGFSLRSMFLDATIQLTRRIRQRFNFPIIYGGIAATVEPQRCIQYSDIICLGEGEQSMLEIADRIDQKRPLNDIGNLWLRLNGRIYKNRLYPLEQNLDRFSFPDYDSENKFWIYNSKLVEQDSSIGNLSEYTYEIITSRGCPFSCNYCCNNLYKEMYQGQSYLRRRSVENVIAELKQAKKKYGIKSILFRDEVFTSNREWINRFSKAYQQEIGLPFWCNTHPLFADAGILNSLKDCGLYSVTMGIQSGSKNILYNVYNRRTSIASIVKAADILEKLNLPIRPRYDIISNNPFEEEQDCRQTLELLMKLRKPVNFGITKLSFIPNTKIVKMPQKKIDNQQAQQRYKFWNNLYLLNQYRFFPNPLIQMLSKSQFLRKHPQSLQPLLIVKFVELKWQGLLKMVKRHLPKGMVLFLKGVRYLLKRY